LLAASALARPCAVLFCLWAFCFEHGCAELPLISTVTGGFQDKSNCPLKTFSYWLTWFIVAVGNFLQWIVLNDVYPKKSQGFAPRIWSISFHLLLFLDIAQQTCRVPGYHADFVAIGFALAVLSMGMLLFALRQSEAHASAPCALTVAWMAWLSLGLTGLYLCTWFPTLDHHFGPTLAEYTALFAYTVMIAALGVVPWRSLACAKDMLRKTKFEKHYAACSSSIEGAGVA